MFQTCVCLRPSIYASLTFLEEKKWKYAIPSGITISQQTFRVHHFVAFSWVNLRSQICVVFVHLEVPLLLFIRYYLFRFIFIIRITYIKSYLNSHAYECFECFYEPHISILASFNPCITSLLSFMLLLNWVAEILIY